MRRDWINGKNNGWEGQAGRDAIKLLTGKVDDGTWKSIDAMHRKDTTQTVKGADARSAVREGRKTTSLKLASTETKRFAEMFAPVTRFVEYMENYKGRGMFEVTEAGYDEMARLLNVTPEAVAGYAKQIKDAETESGEPLLVTVKRLRAAHALATGGN